MIATVYNCCARWPLCYVVARFTGTGWAPAVFADEFGEGEPIYRSLQEYPSEVEAERAIAVEWQTVGALTRPEPA